MLTQIIPNATKFTDKGYNWTLHYGKPRNEFYTKLKTKHYQVFDNIPQYIEQYAKKNFEMYSTSMIKQDPGHFIPNHLDRFYMFRRRYKGMKNILRFCVFLEDWKPGHYLDVAGEPLIKWKRGQYVELKQGIWHRGSNSGDEPKYTVQVTGVLKTKKKSK